MGINRFEFTLQDPVDAARRRCLDAINMLGWVIRHDLTQEYRISCYVRIPELLPQAPVYFISLYSEDKITHIVLLAANDELSQAHASDDLGKLKDCITTGQLGLSTSTSSPAQQSFSTAQAKCFISYRRYDSADVTGRIYDRLVMAYNADTIFKDVDNIPLGADFRAVLDHAVGICSVLLLVIGRDWLTVTNEHSKRRLDDPADYVRIEIESAMRRGIPIIPLLVRDAAMPRENELPESLRELVFRNGIQIRSDPDFHRDMDRLIQALRSLLQG